MAALNLFKIVKQNKNHTLILVPVLPILFFFLHNFNQFGNLIWSGDVLMLFLGYTLFSYTIFGGYRLILKNHPSSFFLGTMTVTFFLFYGILQDKVLAFRAIPLLSKSFFLLLLIALLLTALTISLRKRINTLKQLNNYFFLLFSIIICYEVILLIAFKTAGKNLTAASRNMTTPIPKQAVQDSNNQPDIYHIVFDGYTNKNALKDYWGFNNSIYEFLDSNNFYTVDSAISNYNFTPLSMASVFNLQYLHNGEKLAERNAANFFAALYAYKNNQLFNILEQKGYQLSLFSFLSDTKELAAFGNFAPEKPQAWLRKQTLERIYLSPWTTNKLKKVFGKGGTIPLEVQKSLEHYRDYNERALTHLISASRNQINKVPIFSFTHFLLPHGPYIFDENGKSSISLKPTGDEMKNYLEQVKYANLLIKQITQHLLRDDSRKKIIIFQGDHGYRNYVNAPFNREYDALNAVYFFNQEYSGLKEYGSHVNTYRVVLNNCFSYNLPLLQDSIVIAPGGSVSGEN